MIDKPGQVSEDSGQGGVSRPNPGKSRPAEPEPNRLVGRLKNNQAEITNAWR